MMKRKQKILGSKNKEKEKKRNRRKEENRTRKFSKNKKKEKERKKNCFNKDRRKEQKKQTKNIEIIMKELNKTLQEAEKKNLQWKENENHLKNWLPFRLLQTLLTFSEIKAHSFLPTYFSLFPVVPNEFYDVYKFRSTPRTPGNSTNNHPPKRAVFNPSGKIVGRSLCTGRKCWSASEEYWRQRR